jgi:quercetin dioxygenase-like cupin family protein
VNRLICILAAVLATAGAAYATTAKPPIVAQPLGQAQVRNTETVKITKGSNLIVVRVTVRPGGSFGWHVHHSAVAAAVVSGTLTLYDSSDPKCAAQRVTAGHGFIEPVDHVHLGRNEGTKPAVVLVTYLGVPKGSTPDAPAQQPAQCSLVK